MAVEINNRHTLSKTFFTIPDGMSLQIKQITSNLIDSFCNRQSKIYILACIFYCMKFQNFFLLLLILLSFLFTENLAQSSFEISDFDVATNYQSNLRDKQL